jgi:hypothetical protein
MKLSRKLKSAWRNFAANYDTSKLKNRRALTRTFKLFGIGGNPSAFFFGEWLESKDKVCSRRR